MEFYRCLRHMHLLTARCHNCTNSNKEMGRNLSIEKLTSVDGFPILLYITYSYIYSYILHPLRLYYIWIVNKHFTTCNSHSSWVPVDDYLICNVWYPTKQYNVYYTQPIQLFRQNILNRQRVYPVLCVYRERVPVILR